MAEEGRADGRRVPAEQPVHVPVDGEARGLLRDDPARAQGAGHLAGAAEGPDGQRALGVHVVEVQPGLRPGRDRHPGGLPAVHEAVRRRRLGRGLPDHRRDRAAQGLRRVRAAADAPAGLGRGLRLVRPVADHRGRDDGDEVPARAAHARPVRGGVRLPAALGRARGAGDLQADQRVLPVGVQLLRVARARRRRAPDRLRQRLPGHRDHLAALLLPVGDQHAAQVVGVLRGDRAAAAAGHQHQGLLPRGRLRPVVRGQAGRVRAAGRRVLREGPVRGVLRDLAGVAGRDRAGLGRLPRVRRPARGHREGHLPGPRAGPVRRPFPRPAEPLGTRQLEVGRVLALTGCARALTGV